MEEREGVEAEAEAVTHSKRQDSIVMLLAESCLPRTSYWLEF